MSDYVPLKELSQLLGTTSHVVGRTLKEVGLRTKDGKPTRAAFAGGYCAQRWFDGKYVWAWEKGKTLRVLDEAGLERRSGPGEVAPGEAAECERAKRG